MPSVLRAATIQRGLLTGMGKRREEMTVRVVPLLDTVDSGLSGILSVAERVELVETLTREAWAISGKPLPTYSRADCPVRVASLHAGLMERIHRSHES